ncbi:MAG: T9SS type A sorting domain-containing protein [Chitinophagaceae bacterium]|nr:T9SS type A sorting domain-containing protein [Chitinophagaceae bacterium]
MKKLLLSIMVISVLWILLVYFLSIHSNEFSGEAEEQEEERESGADKQMSSWWWARGYPDGADINEKYYRAWLQALNMKNPERVSTRSGINDNTGIHLFSGNWVSIGPNQSIGGRILSVAIDPQNGNNVFIGSASGGIWKSTSGGLGANAWQPLATGFPVLGVASIIIHPTNSNIIYAGTGEVYRADTSNIGFNVWKARGTYGVGILKSINGGATWARIFTRNESDLFGIQMMKFDPSDPDIIYACTTDGLYRSTDAGSNWTRILNKIYVSDISINPANTDQLVAAVGNLTNADKGIYRSIDGGANWTKITAGLPSSFQGFIRLDNVSASANMIIASIGRSAGSLDELYRSMDFGNTWSILPNSNHCDYQFWFAHDVAINPSNTNQLIMGGVPLYSYNISLTDPGSIGGVHADIHDIEFDPSNSNVVYVACDGGMYKSTNSGGSFSMINGGLHAVQFYASFAVSPSNPNIMIGGLQDNGVVRYNGSGWTSVAGGDGGPCAFHPTNSNIVFASNDARRVLRSTNGGTSFGSEVLESWAFSADSRTGFMAPVAISKSDPTVMYVASDNLHKSTSSGTIGTWNGYSAGTANTFIEAQHKTGIALAVSSTNANKLYVSTSPFAQFDNDVNNLHINTPPNVFKSINGGSSFVNIKNTLPDRFVMDFAVSPTNDDSVWIVLGGYGTSHVYVTGNGGVSWASKGAALPDLPHNAILLDPGNPSIVYVGNDLGVYMSPDNGATWYDFNNSFWDATLVMDLAVTANNKLVAATHGKGAFISDLYAAGLPVTLRDFSVMNQGGYNLLKWTSSSEENVLHFELQSSEDGIDYHTIATIAAANSITGSSYSQKDIPSWRTPATFYRLKMVDRDGKFSYSGIIRIQKPLLPGFIVTENPFASSIKITINNLSTQNIELKLFDAAGKLVAGQKIAVTTGSNNFQINNLEHLAKGTYLLEILLKDQLISKKLVKK